MKDTIIQEKITKLLNEILKNNITNDKEQDLTMVGLDSLNSVALILELEEEFNIEFDDEELLFENFSTINKIHLQVKRKLVDRNV